MVDLTHLLNPDTQTFPVPWHKKIEFSALGTIDTVGRNTTHVHIGSHSGTHIDAPSHFIPNGETIEQIVLEKCVGEFTYFNLRKTNPKEAISVDILKNTVPELKKGKILILDFAWSSNFGEPHYYSHQPFLSYEASEYLLSSDPKMIGYDVAMPDNPLEGFGNTCDSPVHKLFLSHGIPLLENLKIEKPIDEFRTLIALPLRFEGLDGSPVRCIAL
jgi:kynurenine formamidase